MFNPATIKAIQDIMRQDIGVDGDAQRLSQLVWLIFLKILDDEDRALEIRKDTFVPTLPKKYQWRTWAQPLDGLTGDDLIVFVNDDLIPALRILPESSNCRTELTRTAFKDVYNFMRKGMLLKQVINKINEIDFNASKDRHAFNEIYERLLKSLQSAGNFGEMYTPRAVTQFVVEMVNPKIGESVFDPATGTGGFLVNALEHMRTQVKTVEDEHIVQENIFGVEKKPLPFMLLITNLMLHGIEEPCNMRRGNTLEKALRDYTDGDRVDCIVTNPPFGGTEEPGIETNFPKEFQTRETADLFLVLIVRLLKNQGRAGVVLPDGTLFGEGVKTSLKKMLLEECNLHTIVRLPKNVFAPYTGISTNLLFFTKGSPTKEVWYYEHPYPAGKKSYSKTSPIKIEEFIAEKAWWSNRKESDYSWKVSIEEIKDRDFNLDIKNPRAHVDAIESPEILLEKYRAKQKKVKEIIEPIRTAIRKCPAAMMLSDVETIVDNLEDFINVPNGIERLQKTVLTLAISGKLVQQDPSEGTGKDTYAQIEKDIKEASHKKKIAPLPSISSEEIPFEIPKSWMWVRLGEVTNYGRTEKSDHANIVDGTWILELEDLEKNGGRLLSVIEYPTRKPNSDKNQFKKGDVLYGKLRPYLNKVIVADRDGVASSELLPIRWSAPGLPEFLRLLLLSDYFCTYVNNKTYGVKMPRLGTDDGKKAPIPLVPFAEQRRIVTKFEEIARLIQSLRSVLSN